MLSTPCRCTRRTRQLAALSLDPSKAFSDPVTTASQSFVLMPPAEGWRMHLRRYPVAQYQRCGAGLMPELVEPPQEVCG